MSVEGIAELYKGFIAYWKHFICFSHIIFKFYYLNSVSKQVQFWRCGQAFLIHLTCLKLNIKEKQNQNSLKKKKRSNLFTRFVNRSICFYDDLCCWNKSSAFLTCMTTLSHLLLFDKSKSQYIIFLNVSEIILKSGLFHFSYKILLRNITMIFVTCKQQYILSLVPC